MKTIGMLGGMSWESTSEYYRIANGAVREALGGDHSAPIILDSVDFAEVRVLHVADDWDGAGRLLAGHAARLEAAGAELFILCTNSMHKVIGHIEDAIDIPILHIGDTTAEAILAAGLSRVGLIGTRFTMSDGFLRDRISAHGIELIVPDSDDQNVVHSIIFDELVRGDFLDTSRKRLQTVMDRLVEKGAEGIILGCTEIELLIAPEDVPVPSFPTTRLHAEAAVRAALS